MEGNSYPPLEEEKIILLNTQHKKLLETLLQGVSPKFPLVDLLQLSLSLLIPDTYFLAWTCHNDVCNPSTTC